MKGLASYIMRGRVQAMLFTAVFAAFSMIIPPLSYFSGASAALVTLRKGAFEGLINIVGAGVIIGLLASLASGYALLVVVFALVVWTPAWILALTLRLTINLPLTLTIGAAMGAVAVIGFYAVVPDPAAWWREALNAFFEQTRQQPGELGVTVERAAQVMTGLLAAALFAGTAFSLLIGRWWQSTLYNPGGFQREFHAFRLGRGVGVGILGIVLVALAASGTLASLATDISTVFLTLYALAGLALTHDTVARKNAKVGWLIGLYALLLIALPQMLVLLALLGLSDSWLNYRRFLPQNTRA